MSIILKQPVTGPAAWTGKAIQNDTTWIEHLQAADIQALDQALAALKAKGLTIILVEQNFRFAAPLADRHYVMEHGQIVATVHKNELDNKAQMLNEYLGV